MSEWQMMTVDEAVKILRAHDYPISYEERFREEFAGQPVWALEVDGGWWFEHQPGRQPGR